MEPKNKIKYIKKKKKKKVIKKKSGLTRKNRVKTEMEHGRAKKETWKVRREAYYSQTLFNSQLRLLSNAPFLTLTPTLTLIPNCDPKEFDREDQNEKSFRFYIFFLHPKPIKSKKRVFQQAPTLLTDARETER